jgi:hypothetical protein
MLDRNKKFNMRLIVNEKCLKISSKKSVKNVVKKKKCCLKKKEIGEPDLSEITCMIIV